MKTEEWLRLKAKRFADRKKKEAEIADTRKIVAKMVKVVAPPGGPKYPLKIGIDKDIYARCHPLMPLLSRRLISQMLRDYTEGPTYLREMKAGAKRVDIDGMPAGTVTELEAKRAKEMLEEKARRKDAIRERNARARGMAAKRKERSYA